jgi:hypothetical protein
MLSRETFSQIYFVFFFWVHCIGIMEGGSHTKLSVMAGVLFCGNFLPLSHKTKRGL